MHTVAAFCISIFFSFFMALFNIIQHLPLHFSVVLIGYFNDLTVSLFNAHGPSCFINVVVINRQYTISQKLFIHGPVPMATRSRLCGIQHVSLHPSDGGQHPSPSLT